jgi:hypothetical protein
VNSVGELQTLIYTQSSKTWKIYGHPVKDQCDNYKMCGPYSVCDADAFPVCQCIEGFSLKNDRSSLMGEGWSQWSDGCVSQTNLACWSDEFYEMENVKLPETSSVFVNTTMEIKECGNLCLSNCSCTAGYANVYVTSDGGSGCVMWFGELVDIKKHPAEGQDLYIRRAHPKLSEYA